MAPGLFFRITTVITLTGGTIFLRWGGEQITQRGVGNGISLIIMPGIVANLPLALFQVLELGRTGVLSALLIIGLLIGPVAVVARSAEHTSELQSLMRISSAVFCLKHKTQSHAKRGTYDAHNTNKKR